MKNGLSVVELNRCQHFAVFFRMSCQIAHVTVCFQVFFCVNACRQWPQSSHKLFCFCIFARFGKTNSDERMPSQWTGGFFSNSISQSVTGIITSRIHQRDYTQIAISLSLSDSTVWEDEHGKTQPISLCWNSMVICFTPCISYTVHVHNTHVCFDDVHYITRANIDLAYLWCIDVNVPFFIFIDTSNDGIYSRVTRKEFRH